MEEDWVMRRDGMRWREEMRRRISAAKGRCDKGTLRQRNAALELAELANLLVQW